MPKPLTQTFVDRAKTDTRQLIADGGCKGLYLDVRPGGKTFRYRYTGKDRRQKNVLVGDASVLALGEAREEAHRLRRLVARQGSHEETTEDEVPTFEDFVCKSYMPYALARQRAASQKWTLYRNHLFPAFGSKRLNEIKRSDIADYMRLKAERYSPATCNRHLALLKATMSYAFEIELPGLIKNPAHRFRQLPDPPRIDRFLSGEEAQRLYRELECSASPMLKWIVAFLLLTGARKREVLDARWQDFDLESATWIIPMTKSGKPRFVSLSEKAVLVLHEVARTRSGMNAFSPFAFSNPATGKPYTSIFHPWDVIRRRAGLPDVRIHDLRHSFASALINSGMTIYDVKEALGHASIVTTQRYAHLSRERMREAVRKAADHYGPQGLIAPPQ